MLPMDLPVPHEDGSFISERVSRIAEIANDYDRHIEVRWIPPNKRGHNEPGFAIVYSGDDGREYVMFYVQDESQFDGTVLERIYQMDAEKHGNILSKIDAQNEAVRRIQRAQYEEMMEEQIRISHSILKSSKHTYKHNGVRYE